MNFRSLSAEQKRRRVYSVSAAYVVVAWLLIQVATQVFPFFAIPSWVVRLVVVFALIGFPIAVVCAWALEITPAGIKLEGDIDRKVTRETGRKLAALIVIVAAMAAGVTAFRFLHLQQATEAGRQLPLAAVIESKSIAVLPFENRSEDKANAYFAEGIQNALAVCPIEKDAADGPQSLDILARVTTHFGDPDRAIATLQKILSTPCNGGLATGIPLTPALLKLDPMFDPLRSDPRFKQLVKPTQ